MVIAKYAGLTPQNSTKIEMTTTNINNSWTPPYVAGSQRPGKPPKKVVGTMQKRKGPRQDISLDEITIQVALGTLVDPYHIAGFILVTTDIKAIVWAANHASAKVREAAVRNPRCSLGLLVKLGLIDTANAVRNASREALILRKDEFKDFLFVVEEYPQLALSFYHTARTKTATEVPAPPEIDQE